MKMPDGFKSRLRGWTGIQGDWSGWTWLEDRSVKLMVETSLWEANLQVLQWSLDEAREQRTSWIPMNRHLILFHEPEYIVYMIYDPWRSAWNWQNDRHSSNSTYSRIMEDEGESAVGRPPPCQAHEEKGRNPATHPASLGLVFERSNQPGWSISWIWIKGLETWSGSGLLVLVLGPDFGLVSP